MPGSDVREWGGYRVRAVPHSRWRRRFHWPFYFESWNPSFDVELTKLNANAAAALTIEAAFADGVSKNPIGSPLLVPQGLAVGETAVVTTRPVYSTVPGQTSSDSRSGAANGTRSTHTT